MDTPTTTSASQACYNIIKASKEPLTSKEIMAALGSQGYQCSPVVIQGLMARKYLKHGGTKDGYVTYTATDVPTQFSVVRRINVKRKYVRKADALLKLPPVQSTAVIADEKSPEEIKADAEREMATAYNALQTLQNAVATVKFAQLLDKHGPDQMLLMLAGVDRLSNKH